MDANIVLGLHRSAVGQQLGVIMSLFIVKTKGPEDAEIPLLLSFFPGGDLPLHYFPGSSRRTLLPSFTF